MRLNNQPSESANPKSINLHRLTPTSTPILQDPAPRSKPRSRSTRDRTTQPAETKNHEQLSSISKLLRNQTHQSKQGAEISQTSRHLISHEATTYVTQNTINHPPKDNQISGSVARKQTRDSLDRIDTSSSTHQEVALAPPPSSTARLKSPLVSNSSSS
ncbi:hypothetical protein Droror1_Dr00000969 [Drosera rotundifolia]